ncbi:MAG: T9SS type A sorting domain-containing protein [Bacteroidota bacterium]
MRHLFLSISLAVFIATSLFSQSLTFERTYGGDTYEDARSITPAGDGCFVFTGLDKSSDDPTGDTYLTKINAAGAVIWSKNYGLPKEDGGNFLLSTSDGGFLIVGHTANSYGEECDGYLVKTDADGDEQWHLFLGTPLDDVCSAGLEEGGAFFLTGRILNPADRLFDVMLAKVSASGELLFLKNLPGSGDEHGFKIELAANGGFFIAGYAKELNGGGDEQMLVLKCDAEGNLLWRQVFGTEFHDRAYSVLPSTDGGCIVAGGNSELPYTEKRRQPCLAKLDAGGNLRKFQSILPEPGTGYLFDGCQDKDGRLAFAGFFQKENAAVGNACLLLADSDLNLLDFRVLESEHQSEARSLQSLGNDEFVLAGGTSLPGAPPDIWLAKMNLGSSVSGSFEVAEQPILLFPNPFSELAYFKVGNAPQPKTLTLTNLEGKVMKSVSFDDVEMFLSRGDLPAGAYFFAVLNAKGEILAKGRLVAR